jgi:hypothetical protein
VHAEDSCRRQLRAVRYRPSPPAKIALTHALSSVGIQTDNAITKSTKNKSSHTLIKTTLRYIFLSSSNSSFLENKNIRKFLFVLGVLFENRPGEPSFSYSSGWSFFNELKNFLTKNSQKKAINNVVQVMAL